MSLQETAQAWLSRSEAGLRALSARKALMSLPYIGLSKQCPSCNWRFRQFRPFGLQSRDDAYCSRCGTLERHRALWLYLQRELGFPSATPSRLLHFAPEPTLMRKFKRVANLDYVSFDLASPFADVHGDICDLPFDDDSFDGILCNHVLEHVIDDRKAMAELRRVLRPGGWAMLQVPWEAERAITYEDPSIVDPEERAAHFYQSDHVRVYGRDYVTRLEDAGFTVKIERVGEYFSDAECTRYGLSRCEDLFLCR